MTSDITDSDFSEWILSKVESEWENCERCGLCDSRENVVFGEGSGDADLFIIGEAPGEKEDAKGRPFVGPSGAILRRSLRAVGIGLSEVYITNRLACRPPKNRSPHKGEMEECQPRLNRQISLVRPRVVLLLGSYAARLCGIKSITKERGEIDREQWPGVFREIFELSAVVATYHPSYILHKESKGAKRIALATFVADLRKAKGALDG